MASTTISPDMTFINELYEEIENNPPGLGARKLLIQQFLTAEWNDSALGAAQQYVFLKGTFCPPRSIPDLWVLLPNSTDVSLELRIHEVRLSSNILLLLSDCLLRNFSGYFSSILKTLMPNLECLYYKMVQNSVLVVSQRAPHAYNT